MTRPLLAVLLVCSIAETCGCHHDQQPPAVGVLTKADISDLRRFSCLDGQLDVERVCGRQAWTPFCGVAPLGLDGGELPQQAPLATTRISCRRRGGWTMWLDDRGQLLGACADKNTMFTSIELLLRRLADHLSNAMLGNLYRASIVDFSADGLRIWFESPRTAESAPLNVAPVVSAKDTGYGSACVEFTFD